MDVCWSVERLYVALRAWSKTDCKTVVIKEFQDA